MSAFAIPAALAAAQGTMSFIGAQQQAEAIDRAIASQRRSARIQARQVSQSAQLRRQQRLREAQQIRGTIRVAAAEAGTTTGAFASQMRQADFDADLNAQVIEQNRRNRIQRIESTANANLLRLSSRRPSPGLAAATGALRGLGTGLQIGGAIQRMGARAEQQNTLAQRRRSIAQQRATGSDLTPPPLIDRRNPLGPNR